MHSVILSTSAGDGLRPNRGDWQWLNDHPTIFNHGTILNRTLAVVNWNILKLVLLGNILLLLLVEDNNTTGTGSEGHIRYFDLYIYYRTADKKFAIYVFLIDIRHLQNFIFWCGLSRRYKPQTLSTCVTTLVAYLI